MNIYIVGAYKYKKFPCLKMNLKELKFYINIKLIIYESSI